MDNTRLRKCGFCLKPNRHESEFFAINIELTLLSTLALKAFSSSKKVLMLYLLS